MVLYLLEYDNNLLYEIIKKINNKTNEYKYIIKINENIKKNIDDIVYDNNDNDNNNNMYIMDIIKDISNKIIKILIEKNANVSWLKSTCLYDKNLSDDLCNCKKYSLIYFEYNNFILLEINGDIKIFDEFKFEFNANLIEYYKNNKFTIGEKYDENINKFQKFINDFIKYELKNSIDKIEKKFKCYIIDKDKYKNDIKNYKNIKLPYIEINKLKPFKKSENLNEKKRCLEQLYNEKMSNELEFILLDRKLDSRNVELADLYDKNTKYFYHIKRYKKALNIRDVIGQIENASITFLNHKNNEKFNKIITENNIVYDENNITFVLGIVMETKELTENCISLIKFLIVTLKHLDINLYIEEIKFINDMIK